MVERPTARNWTATRQILWDKEQKRLREQKKHYREVVQATAVDREIRQAAGTSVERELVGNRGHWIQPTGVINRKRKQFAIYDPTGMFHANIWGEEDARRAVHELIQTGTITR